MADEPQAPSTTGEASPSETKPQSLLDGLTAEGKAELTAFAESIFKPQLEALRKELTTSRRENTKLRNLGGEWTDEQRGRYESDETVRQEAIEFYGARGVPEDAFEYADTPAKVRKQADLWIKHHGDNGDMGKQIEAALTARASKPSGGPGQEKMITAGQGLSGRGRDVTEDTIDALYLDGKVNGAEYSAFLRTGQLPR